MKRRTLVIGTTGLVAAAAVAMGWNARVQRGRIITGVLPTVTWSGAPASLQERLNAARGRAFGWWGGVAALEELSALYHANGFSAEAMQIYTTLAQLEPDEPRWLHRHATLLAENGDVREALKRWERVRTLAPEYLAAQIRLGDLLLKNNDAKQAAAVYAAILKRQANHPHALLGLARIDLEAGRWDEARTRIEAVVAQTDYALGYDLIVTVWEHLGEHARAAAVRGRVKASGAYRDVSDPWIEELMDACYDPFRLSIEAGAAQRRGEIAVARRRLERAVELAPQEVSARFQLGALLAAERDLAGARREWERCTVVVPGFADAWAQWAASLQQTGDGAGAERVVTAGLQACPESPGLWLMRARQRRAVGRTAEAIAAYETAIRYRTNEADAFLELATTLFRLERVPEGLQRLEQGLTAEPEHPPTLALLAFHAIGNGDSAAASAWMRRVERQPRVPREQVERLRAAFREQFGRAGP